MCYILLICSSVRPFLVFVTRCYISVLLLLVKTTEHDKESLITIPTDDLRKIEKSLSTKRNSVNPEQNHDLEGFTETLKVKETTLPAINPRFDLDLRNVKVRKNKKRVNEMNDYNLNKTDGQGEITWVVVASVFDRFCFLLFLSIKLAYNIVLIGNLFYQRTTDY